MYQSPSSYQTGLRTLLPLPFRFFIIPKGNRLSVDLREKEWIISSLLDARFDGLGSLKVIKQKINIYWLVSLLYMGLIFYLSSYPEPIETPSFSYFDKLVHIGEYGILASLIHLSLRNTNAAKYHLFGLTFAIAFIYGVSDEIHQYFVPGRQADILDVLANGIGAFCFPLILHRQNDRSKAKDPRKVLSQ